MFRNAVIARQFFRYKQSVRLARRYASEPTPPSGIARLEARLPRFLQRIVTPIRHAPVSHVTAFLLLHEITAIAPLLGLAGAFHYFNWLPPYISEGKWVHEYTEKFGKYLRKKGWISDQKRSGKWFGRGQGGVRIVVELATAWAITKALLPLRLVVSVWGTPWFARWAILPLTSRITRLLGRGKAVQTSASPAAGTGAIGGGVVSRDAKSSIK